MLAASQAFARMHMLFCHRVKHCGTRRYGMHVCVCADILDEANFVPTTIPEARAAVILYNMLCYREKLEAEEVNP
jgi:hypothetical protein